MKFRHELWFGALLGLVACGGEVTPSQTNASEPTSRSPVDEPRPAAASGDPAVLVDGAERVTSIAVDRDAVYWTTLRDDGVGDVLRVARDGGAPSIIAAEQAAPRGLHVSGGSLTWINARRGAGAVMTMPTTGGAARAIATSEGVPVGPAVSGDVFYADEDSGALYRATKDGPPTLVTHIGMPTALAADDTFAYYLEDRVLRVQLDGSFPERVSDPCFYPTDIAVGAADVFFACQDGTVRAAAKSQRATRTLYSRPVGGGTFGGIAIDERSVYVSNIADGTVLRIDASSNAVDVVVQGEAPGVLAVDDTSVFVAMRGRILRVAK